MIYLKNFQLKDYLIKLRIHFNFLNFLIDFFLVKMYFIIMMLINFIIIALFYIIYNLLFFFNAEQVIHNHLILIVLNYLYLELDHMVNITEYLNVVILQDEVFNHYLKIILNYLMDFSTMVFSINLLKIQNFN